MKATINVYERSEICYSFEVVCKDEDMLCDIEQKLYERCGVDGEELEEDIRKMGGKVIVSNVYYYPDENLQIESEIIDEE